MTTTTKASKTLALLVLACAAAGTSAQQVWRCGSTYSQQPCPGGAAVQADDARSREQAQQAEAAARRQGQAADALEKSRLAQEAKADRERRAGTPTASAARREREEKDRTYSEVKAKKAPYFTAVSPRKPGEEGKKAGQKASAKAAPAKTTPAKTEPALKDAKAARSG